METDCRSEVGVTVGLVDAIITMTRLLTPRDVYSTEAQEALCDLWADEDFQFLITRAMDARRAII